MTVDEFIDKLAKPHFAFTLAKQYESPNSYVSGTMKELAKKRLIIARQDIDQLIWDYAAESGWIEGIEGSR